MSMHMWWVVINLVVINCLGSLGSYKRTVMHTVVHVQSTGVAYVDLR